MSSLEGRESTSASGDTKDNNNNNDQEHTTATTAKNNDTNNESPSSSTNQNKADTTATANNSDSSAPAPATNNTGDTPQTQQQQQTSEVAATAPETSETTTTTTTTAKTAFAETDQNTNKADSNNNKDQTQQNTDASAAASAGAGTTTTENSNTNTNNDQQQESSAAASTTGATAGTSTTATTSTAATAATSSSSPAATTTTTASRPGRVRPVVQLTQNLVQTYHDANEKVYWRKRQDIPGPKFNDGYDDSSGHYIVYPGEEIIGRYVTLETLGKGSFGTVVRCKDTKRNEIVAAKITRSGSGFRNQAKLEIDILMRILTQSPDAKIVRILKAFDWKGHLVIVFELLSFNLYQLMQCTNYHGVSLDLTSKFAFQLLMVLRDLERLNPPVIHCDLKPENVLLVNQNRSAIRVIDFGSACYQNRRMFRYIQSRYYRSPEVILGLEYSTAIDRWSLGCILMELHTGVALFDGRNEAQQLQRFEGLLGPLPDSMIAASSKKDQFYDTMTLDDGTVAYTLKLQPEPQHRRTIAGILERPQRRRSSRANATSETTSTTAAATTGEASSTTTTTTTTAVSGGGNSNNSTSGGVESQERYEQFVDIVKKLLEYDPAKRIGVLQAMEHPFLCEFMPYYQQRLANQQNQQQGGGSSTSGGNTTNNNNNTTAGNNSSNTTATSGNTAAAASLNPSAASTATAPSTTAAAASNNNNSNSTSGNNNNANHPSASASTAQLPPPPSM